MLFRGNDSITLGALGILFALYILGQGLFFGLFSFADPALNLFLSFAGILLLLGLGLVLLTGLRAIAPVNLGFSRVDLKWILMAAFAAGLALVLVTFLGLLISQEGRAALDQYTGELAVDETRQQFILTVITVSVLVPLVEETLFRGALFTALAERVNLVAAFALSSLLFALLHSGTLAATDSWPDQLIVITSLTLIGLFAAWLRHVSGSLLPAIAMHGIYNAFVLTFQLASS